VTIERLAPAYSLEPRLVEAILWVKSSDHPESIRFEPHIYDRLLTAYPHLSPTERMQQATSWGLLQVMGMVCCERGFTGCCVELCRDPEGGLRVGMSHLAWLATRAKDRDEMIRAYNAGSGGAQKGRGGAYLQKVQRMYAALTR
jgi:hypothetical protein